MAGTEAASLKWLNNLLKTNFKEVQDMASGAYYCQIMDCTMPGSVDMAKVKFDIQCEDDCKHNFTLLQEAFKKEGITKDIPVEELIQEDVETNSEFLKWFKVFHLKNNNKAAKENLHKSSMSASPSPENSRRDTRYTEKWKEALPWADRSSLGDDYTFCTTCQSNLHTINKGFVELQRHSDTRKHKKKAKLYKQNISPTKAPNLPLPCSDAAIHFIRSHCNSAPTNGEKLSKHFLYRTLGRRYPKDIASVCQNTPYCLYIYEGVSVGKDQHVSVMLVGFYDTQSSAHSLRFLDAFGGGDQMGYLQTLKKFKLPAENLAAVYVSGDGAASEQICSGLRELNPSAISIGPLYSIADVACCAGLKKLSGLVQELLSALEAQHFSSSIQSDDLEALLDSVYDKKSSKSFLDIGCLKFCQLVSKILEIWTDLTDHFSSRNDKEAKLICSQLQDIKVRAAFLFLKQALKPLEKFQTQTQGGSWTSMLLILEEASSLLSTYTSRFLQQNAAARYLEEHDALILRSKKSLLSSPDLDLGGEAVEDALRESDEPAALLRFREQALSFYAALTGCIAEELPLSVQALRSIAQLLSPQSWLEVTGAQVEELGNQLGVCNSADETKQLTKEFLERKTDKEAAAHASTDPDSLKEHWSRLLDDSKPSPLFRRLVLTLLSLPCPPLNAKQVFTQVLETSEVSSEEEATESDCDVSFSQKDVSIHPPNGKNTLQLLKKSMKPCEVRLTRIDSLNIDEYQENEWSHRRSSGWESGLRRRPRARTIFQAGAGTWCKPVDLDDEDKTARDDTREERSRFGKHAPTKGQRKESYQDAKGFPVGELVWGKVKSLSLWPGMVAPWMTRSPPVGMRRVEWFGDGMFSEVNTDGLLPFSSFSRSFCKNSFASLPKYKKAIYEILELAAERSRKSFTDAQGNKEKELKMMLEWAFEGFLPTGPEGFAPPNFNDQEEPSEVSDEYLPKKRKYVSKNRTSTSTVTYNRDLLIDKIKRSGKKIEDFCLSCSSPDVDVQHPLFEGGLCLRCKENFSETLYRYDDDGYQSYCTVCCAGQEVVLCDNVNCCRCFCKDCLNLLIGDQTFEKLRDTEKWNCFMCKPSQCEGYLLLRPDWSVRVQDFFANSTALEFEPHRVYPSIPAAERRPLKVLSLFDGIATGYLVLKGLGCKVERYIASEICDDSIAVGMIKHEGKIEYVNDVRTITRKHLAEWGPFDLLIGGSPCNDLATVNPNRKGLYEGTGRLFFEFYRILNLLRPREEDNRPFFWLFENVVHMNARDKTDICRFLECNPVLIDAIHVSPAHRARYFWGNLPGMSRPVTTSLDDKVKLQDCLEIGRVARFDKVRTITTKTNCMWQGKIGQLPVTMNGKDDSLWCTEMELIFGFPKHYTDVNNMSRMQRQRVLGRSWSVPVIRHLLAPLKDYYECEERV
ncbi:DNA (cytosine-5-)-methyltransferase 3 beta, duplicate a [Oryzias melastigma]|uniref:DNA (cytosine-5-)-methyltransferase n=1 Tax=Oryzias melastigma TaxID=30732 RepID=A0A3B3D0C0_ORYME|nr:DNA (cytosine-5-)-methyltransferase 3 beta, duplicate a [Oryzias melastigma]